MGTAIGIAVPAWQVKDRGGAAPGGREWAAIGAGVLAGSLLAHWVPLLDDVSVAVESEVSLAPVSLAGGGTGLAVTVTPRGRSWW